MIQMLTYIYISLKNTQEIKDSIYYGINDFIYYYIELLNANQFDDKLVNAKFIKLLQNDYDQFRY